MVKRLSIRIYPDGRIEAKTQGIHGRACMPMIGYVENLLDAQVVESEHTKEYYTTEAMKETTQDVKQQVKGQN